MDENTSNWLGGAREGVLRRAGLGLESDGADDGCANHGKNARLGVEAYSSSASRAGRSGGRAGGGAAATTAVTDAEGVVVAPLLEAVAVWL